MLQREEESCYRDNNNYSLDLNHNKKKLNNENLTFYIHTKKKKKKPNQTFLPSLNIH